MQAANEQEILMTGNPRTVTADESAEMASERGGARQGLAAAGGVLGALAASSCCLLPLALTVAGISGAWMANLRALAPYQPIFIAMTVAVLGYGFYLVYRKPRKACLDGSCQQPAVPGGIVKTALWSATLLVLLAVTFAAWFPLIVPYLP